LLTDLRNRNGNAIAEKLIFLGKGNLSTNSNGNPASGTNLDSSPALVPRTNTLFVESLATKAEATVSKGLTCPAVPPPVRRKFVIFL
jgi:hypothetical protein